MGHPRAIVWRRLAIALGIAGVALRFGAVGCARSERGPEALVLVVVDTLRADRLFDRRVPRWQHAQLAPWLARARVYDRAFSSSSWTLPSFASIYTGQIPSRHGAGQIVGHADQRNFTAIATDLEGDGGTLAERLWRQGYATGAIVNNAALAPDFGVARGFDEYDYTPSTNRQILRADRVVDRSLAYVDRHADESFFLVVHVFDPHMDYDPPPGTRGRFTRGMRSTLTLPITGARRLSRHPGRVSKRDRAFIAAAYDEEVAFVDTQLARLLQGLAQRGVMGRGLVAITADHGEELFEHGGFEHGHAMWQQIVHVPMAFLGDGVKPGRDEAPVSLLDLAPTFLEVAGAPPIADQTGVSLWPNLRSEATLPHRPLFLEGTLYGPEQKSVIDWPFKLIWWPESRESLLYDLSRDPEEMQPVRDDPATHRRLLELLRRTTREAAEARGDSTSADLLPETLEALRKLGYAE
jgi:arylsulfatase A-like enzyme